VGEGEGDGLGRRELCGEDQIALVLAVLVVGEDDHPPGAELVEDLVDRGERAGHAEL